MKLYQNICCRNLLASLAALLSLGNVRGNVPLPVINFNNILVVTNSPL